MSKFEVCIAFTDYTTTVEAKTDDEARKLAFKEAEGSIGYFVLDRGYVADVQEVEDDS